MINFGEGGVDDAEDADVILHELGHGIHDWITNGSLSQVDGLSEGMADYWAPKRAILLPICCVRCVPSANYCVPVSSWQDGQRKMMRISCHMRTLSLPMSWRPRPSSLLKAIGPNCSVCASWLPAPWTPFSVSIFQRCVTLSVVSFPMTCIRALTIKVQGKRSRPTSRVLVRGCRQDPGSLTCTRRSESGSASLFHLVLSSTSCSSCGVQPSRCASQSLWGR